MEGARRFEMSMNGGMSLSRRVRSSRPIPRRGQRDRNGSWCKKDRDERWGFVKEALKASDTIEGVR
ncbi:hypothetical protein RJ639_020205 [Escallonia herrerae]|uniref:Uncharacterized protein n=1 Tax=Escallonia herrerae TaxID=1293975 RepID=A0AA88V8Z0_9ASTE|nr:hypothetical protein RJ639_020205 [Escallonia herrerae]